MKSIKKVVLPLVLALAMTVGVIGCSVGMQNAGDLVKKAYTVVVRCDAVLAEIDVMTAGSDLNVKIKPNIDQVRASLVAVKSTIQTIAGLMGVDLSTIQTASNKAPKDSLKDATDELNNENAKLQTATK